MSIEIKVLIVDDDEDILRMAARYLSSRGLVVLTSDTPFGVSTLISRERPAVVVLDVMMPALSGEALAGLIGTLAHDSAVVFYSALDEHRLKELAAGVEGATYVSKTAGLAALHEVVNRAALARAMSAPERS